jgi:predicted lipase
MEDITTYLEMLKLTMLIYDYGKNFTEYNNIENLEISDLNKTILTNIINNNPNGNIVKFISLNNGLQVCITISHTNSRITIIFRGSESLKDWLYDLLIIQTKLKDNVYIHKGFKEQLEPAKDDLIYTISKLLQEYPKYKLYTTGHSLGAALSTLFGYYLSEVFSPNEVNIVSFASPRVGNKAWSDLINNKHNLNHFRFINDKDIVVSIPYINYYHAGLKCYLNKNKLLFIDNEIDNDCCLSFYSPLDHSIEKYYDNLNNFINTNN